MEIDFEMELEIDPFGERFSLGVDHVQVRLSGEVVDVQLEFEVASSRVSNVHVHSVDGASGPRVSMIGQCELFLFRNGADSAIRVVPFSQLEQLP